LEQLQLAVRQDGGVRPLPALARFALGEADIRENRIAATQSAGSLF
jgi:hypothetical protein